MPAAPPHPAEADRLASLAGYPMPDDADPKMRTIVDAAAALAQTPVALIGLLDAERQFFLARRGVEATWIPRSWAMCGYVVATGEAVVIPDTHKDLRCADNPLAAREPQLRAYLGVPMIGRDGLPLGTLCVIDHMPRRFPSTLVRQLEALAGTAADLLDLRRSDVTTAIETCTAVGTSRDIRRALVNNELVLHYQPVVDLTTRQVVNYEALLRWQHPTRGLLAPNTFLPLVERGQLADAVGRWVLDRAVAQAAARGGTIAVNVAAGQWSAPGFVDDVLSVLAVHGLPPQQLILEVSEHQILGGAPAVAAMAALRQSGAAIALDDFGAAFSGLARLNTLPVDILKLDISLVRDVAVSERAQHIVGAVIDLAARLDLRVVAEGVETPSQCDSLQRRGCQMGQGWLFGRPRPPWQITSVPAPADSLHLPPSAEEALAEPSTARVRNWAREVGITVPARGRLPARIRQAYLQAH
ncbi:MAG: EAL domain-containing protein [Actinomycetota bacterium]|nr:EAL domain-containing protein [Actinomycetota bacterium]